MHILFIIQGATSIELDFFGNRFSWPINRKKRKRFFIIASLLSILSFCLVAQSYAEGVTTAVCETQDTSLQSSINDKGHFSQSPPKLLYFDDSKKTFLNPVSDTQSTSDFKIKKEKKRDWNKLSFLATAVGAFLTVVSILVMYFIFRSDNKGAKEQLSLLKRQINNSDAQLQNQKNSLLTSAKNNLTVVNEMRKSVFTIQDYMVNKDVYLKLVEHKQAINSAFSFLLKNHLMRQGFNLVEGTVLQDEQVNNKVGAILEHIAIIDGLLDNKPTGYSEKKMLCENDLNSLFSRRSIHNDDVANWIKDVKKHFDSLDKILGQAIKEVKKQNNSNGH